MEAKTFLEKASAFLSKAFSEGGEPSCKRIIGAPCLVALHICFAYVLAKYGMTDNVTSFGTTLSFIDGTLLGITSVANAIGKIGGKAE